MLFYTFYNRFELSINLYTKISKLYGVGLFQDLTQFYAEHKGYIGLWLRM